MKSLIARLDRLEVLFRFKSPEPVDLFTDEEKTVIAKIFCEIHGFEWVYKNNSWREVGLIPEGLILFHNGEVFDEFTGELFPKLEAAQRKHPGLPIVPVSAELAQKLFTLLKKVAI